MSPTTHPWSYKLDVVTSLPVVVDANSSTDVLILAGAMVQRLPIDSSFPGRQEMHGHITSELARRASGQAIDPEAARVEAAVRALVVPAKGKAVTVERLAALVQRQCRKFPLKKVRALLPLAMCSAFGVARSHDVRIRNRCVRGFRNVKLIAA